MAINVTTQCLILFDFPVFYVNDDFVRFWFQLKIDTAYTQQILNKWNNNDASISKYTILKYIQIESTRNQMGVQNRSWQSMKIDSILRFLPENRIESNIVWLSL